MFYILFAIVIFGVLVIVHELGHFLAAKACGVRVNEFSVGMGPQLLHTTRGETVYSLRLLPIGGFCAMAGEDDDCDDERSLYRQSRWKQLVIFAAGVAMNFLIGFLLIVFLYADAAGFYTAEIGALNEGFPQEGPDSIMVGDTIYAINGERVYLMDDVRLIMDFYVNGDDTIDLTVLRDGQKLTRTLHKQTYQDENGNDYKAFGFSYGGIVEATPVLRLQYSWYQTLDYVRLVRMSLRMMVTGGVGIDDLSGPVGIVSTITEIGEETEAEEGRLAAIESILFLAAMIAVNLAVMNLLPIPALDGGHILFLLVNGVAMLLFKREIPRKYLNAVSGVGFAALMAFMLFITLHDIIKLF